MNAKTKKKLMTGVKGLVAAVILLITLFPIYWLVAMSIRPTSEMTGRISIIPKTLTIEHFVKLFVASALDGAGDLLGTDLEAGIETTIGGHSFRIRETIRCDDIRKPNRCGGFSNRRSCC